MNNNFNQEVVILRMCHVFIFYKFQMSIINLTQDWVGETGLREATLGQLLVEALWNVYIVTSHLPTELQH